MQNRLELLNLRVGVKYFRNYFSQVQVLFQICKYNYLKYLEIIKYVFNHVQVPSTLVTNNNTVSLDPKLISAVTVWEFQIHSYSLHGVCTHNMNHFNNSNYGD